MNLYQTSHHHIPEYRNSQNKKSIFFFNVRFHTMILQNAQKHPLSTNQCQWFLNRIHIVKTSSSRTIQMLIKPAFCCPCLHLHVSLQWILYVQADKIWQELYVNHMFYHQEITLAWNSYLNRFSVTSLCEIIEGMYYFKYGFKEQWQHNNYCSTACPQHFS